MDNKFERVKSPDDPRRCQAVHQNDTGQCPFRAVEGSKYCVRHGANSELEKQSKESLRTYRLSKWQNRLNELADDPGVKGLREEIGILRIVLEETLNRCHDADELFMNSSKISDTAIKIEKLVTSCHRLESQTGQLLDKSAVLAFASQVVEIISEELKAYLPENQAELLVDVLTNRMMGILKPQDV